MNSLCLVSLSTRCSEKPLSVAFLDVAMEDVATTRAVRGVRSALFGGFLWVLYVQAVR